MASVLQANDLYKEISGEILFQNISFNINGNDKIGIIGINGAGKSTLIKIILGLEDPDINPITKSEGNIFKNNAISIGYLAQHNRLNPENTPWSELMDTYGLKEIFKSIQRIESIHNPSDEDNQSLSYSIAEFERLNGYQAQQNIIDAFNGLNIPEEIWTKNISLLSGGQQTLISLAKTLLTMPDLLILDEPTNHLDLSAITWLETFLKNYPKSVVLISHDTYFLDNVVNKVFEIENKTLKSYKGNYTDYKIQKEIYLSGALKSFKKEEEKKKKLEEFVLKYKAGQKSKQARGRQKLLDRMENSTNPIIPTRKVKLKFEVTSSSSNDILKLSMLSKSFNNKDYLFKNVNIELHKGDKVGLIGKNGVGKSTILKIVNDLESQTTGTFTLGKTLKVGYYDQHHKNLNYNNTILEEISREFNLNEEQTRNIAGGFLFTNDDVIKTISSLSGGERARVSLIKLILSQPNFLIMDEPTNHLDIYSKEVLEEALENYTGTLLVVSHDRQFLDNVTNKIYLIEKNGSTQFNGNYSEYLNTLTQQKTTNPKKKEDANKNTQETSTKQLELKSEIAEQIKKIEKEINSNKKRESYFYEKASSTNNDKKMEEFQKKIEEIEIKQLELETMLRNLTYKLKRN